MLTSTLDAIDAAAEQSDLARGESRRATGNRIVIQVEPEVLKLVPRFLANLRATLAAADDALGRGDFAYLKRAGHDAKGSGGSYGFDAITELGAVLELAGKECDSRAARECLSRMLDYLDRVEPVPDPSGHLT